jgi:hypothetical protein
VNAITACVSVPWGLAGRAGWLLSGGGELQTKDAPEIGRVYFLVPVTIDHDEWPFTDEDDFAVAYFWTDDEAKTWVTRDIQRRQELL